jgi:predicted enzyme related to lactoylglutathione lyase
MSRPVHFEILSENPERLVGFYREALGWEAAVWSGPQSYWLLTTGPEGNPGINGGIMHRHFSQSVINTVGVASIEDTLAKVMAAGGTMVQGPHDIPGIGRHAYCADPDGTLFGVLEPMAREGC